MTQPFRIDYVILTCDQCRETVRHNLTPPLMGSVQLRRWFAEFARSGVCSCGGVSWKISARGL